MIYTRRNLKFGRIDDETLNELKDIYEDALANLGQKKEVIRILKKVLSPKMILRLIHIAHSVISGFTISHIGCYMS